MKIDPIEDREREAKVQKAQMEMPSFEEAARKVHEDKKSGFKNAKHAEQWINTLEQYVFPDLGRSLVSELTAADFARALKPIWLEKAETASRVKQRCDAVMKWSAARGYVLASPVGVVDQLLPKQPGKRERVAHQPAVPWRDIPEFVQTVLRQGLRTKAKIMLDVLILTAWPETRVSSILARSPLVDF